jgi:ABC-type phosphate transport system substrate-binding protein
MGSRARLRRLALLAGLIALAGSPLPAGDQGYWVVVHPDNPVQTLERSEVSRLFLKKTTKWADGRLVNPVDLPEKTATRAAFSRDIHGRSVSAIKKYWQQMVFSGKAAPPPEVPAEADVLAQVRSDPSAVGYVSDEAVLRGVKILDVVDPPAVAAAQPAR